MKEQELRRHAVCSLCRRKIGDSGLPLFWRVTIERFGIDLGAVKRQTGLGMMLTPRLAQVMGPDEDMAQPMMDQVVLTVCETCGTDTENQSHCIAVLAEHEPAKEPT